MKPFIPIHLPFIASIALSQFLSLATTDVTQCVVRTVTRGAAGPSGSFPAASSQPGVSQATETIAPGAPITTTVYMPPCSACDCPTCVHSSTYITTLTTVIPCSDAGSPPDLRTSVATIQVVEVYSGMSAFPTFATPTSQPYGLESSTSADIPSPTSQVAHRISATRATPIVGTAVTESGEGNAPSETSGPVEVSAARERRHGRRPRLSWISGISFVIAVINEVL
jgi:hypothetical protein